VRETAPDQYVAKCSAHDDNSPSLSIRSADDRILVHCFSGCDAEEIMGAVGLSLADLFDKPMQHGPIPKRERWDPRALLRQLRSESEIVLMAGNDIAKGCPLSAVDHERLCKAVNRIARVAEIAS
jgi:hypothetical protein